MRIGLVGRTNVGKSTLFNRLVGSQRAIVTDIPGTTRDIIEEDVTIAGQTVSLLDSPGLATFEDEKVFLDQIISQSDLLLFVVDYKAGVNVHDEEIAELIRQAGKKEETILVVNKVPNNNKSAQTYLADWYRLGFADLVALSAQQGHGVDYLLQKMEQLLTTIEVDGESEKLTSPLPLAIIGRPNVGKSTLVNALIGEEVATVAELPGTTLDYLSATFSFQGRPIKLYDTAGIRKKGKTKGLEKIAYKKSFSMLDYVRPVVILLIDIGEGLTKRDKTLLGELHAQHHPVLVAANKIDLLPPEDKDLTLEQIKVRYEMFQRVPLLDISAKERIYLPKLMKTVISVWDEYSRRVPTSKLNKALSQAWTRHPPRFPKNKICKWKYITQVGTTPPTFYLSVNNKEYVNFAFERRVQNALRASFGFRGVPIKLVFDSTEAENPYTNSA